MIDMIDNVDELLRAAAWKLVDAPKGDVDAMFYVGVTPDGAHVTVASFSIESQGFPAGSRGFDGAIRKENVLQRLTREQASTAVALASGRLKYTIGRVNP